MPQRTQSTHYKGQPKVLQQALGKMRLWAGLIWLKRETRGGLL